MENQYPLAIYEIGARGCISATKKKKRRERRCDAAVHRQVPPDGKLGCALQPWRLCVVRTGLHWTHIFQKKKPKRQSNGSHSVFFLPAKFYLEAPKRPFRAGKCQR